MTAHKANLYRGFDDLSDLPFVARYEIWREAYQAPATKIVTIHDWSGNGNHALQATPAFQATYASPGSGISNGNACAIFDGTDDTHVTSSIPSMNNNLLREYYCVQFPLNWIPGTFPTVFNGANTDADGLGDLSLATSFTGWLLRYAHKTGFSYEQVTPGFASFQLHVETIRCDGTNVYFTYGPGVMNTSFAMASTQVPNGTYKLALGCVFPSSAALFWAGQFYALFVRDRFSTPTEFARIMAYINTIYGTPI